MIDTVLFDLDGTLLDTAPDMARALNAVLVRHERAPLALAAVRPHVSKGGMALVGLGFGLDAEDARAAGLLDELLAYYQENLCADTVLFDGMDGLLTRIAESGRRAGVVTNKPSRFTLPLLRAMKLERRLGCVVSGDTLAQRKPWPHPLWHACEMVGGGVGTAVYVGDDARDIEAGRSAGMRTLAAGYGYITPGDDPHRWYADAVVMHPDEIWGWVLAAA